MAGLLPLLLTVVEGLDTVSLDNIAFRQEASQSLTLGQYKPGTYISFNKHHLFIKQWG